MGLSHSLRRAIASHKAAREAAKKPEPKPQKKLTKKQQLQADCTAAGVDWDTSWTIKLLQAALK